MVTRHDGRRVMPRVLLLEFLFGDKHGRDRADHFPFFLGQARELGAAAQWLCCWMGRRGHMGRGAVELDAAGLAALLAAVEAFAPTHVLTSNPLSDGLAARLRQRWPGLPVHDLWAEPEPRNCPAAWLPALLGTRGAAPDLLLLDAVTPAYDCTLVPVPPGASAPEPPLISIIGGPYCMYRRPLARNRFFADVVLPAGVRGAACTFCLTPPPDGSGYAQRTPPLELALRQCRAALATTAKFAAPDEYKIASGAVALRVGGFLRAILDAGFPPSRFHFSYRADELLGLAAQLDAVLPAVARAGHVVDVFNIGCENFSPDENDRINKGISAAQLYRVAALVARWRRTYPDAFAFGNFSTILFTPWTTLADLAINLEHFARVSALLGERAAGTAPADTGTDGLIHGRPLTSKLQLYAEAPITVLAQRDGLTADSFEGFASFDSLSLGVGNQVEIPWRFRHPQVAAIYQLACRVAAPALIPPGDALLAQVQELYLAHRPRWPHPLAFLVAALEAARAGPATPEAILACMRAEVSRSRAAQARPPGEPATPESEALAAELREHLTLRPSPPGAFRVTAVAGSARRNAVLVLERDGTDHLRFVVHVERREEAKHYFRLAGPYAVSFAGQPRLAPAQRHALEALCRRLASVMPPAIDSR